MIKDPPKRAELLLRVLLKTFHQDDILGDIDEIYFGMVQERGRFRSNFWYWRQVLKSLSGVFFQKLLWSTVMLKNYFTITVRTLKRNRIISFINIFGLAIGLACCISILVWVNDELSYDRFHKNADELYRIISVGHFGGEDAPSTLAPYPLGPLLKENFPEVVDITRYGGGVSGWNLNYQNKSYADDIIAFSDPSFFEMFSFRFLKGDPKTALENRYSVILTESLALKIFGNEEPMGQTVRMNTTDLQVTGVIQDIPANSHIQLDYLIPFDNLKVWQEQVFDSWEMGNTMYVQLIKGVMVEDFNTKIRNIISENVPESSAIVYLQPLKKIHLYSDFVLDLRNFGRGNITYVYVFSLAAFVILVLACINFMNLTLARLFNRFREVGVRKVLGAHKTDLIFQYFCETVFQTGFALLLALILTFFLLPGVNELSGKQLTLNFIQHKSLFLWLLGITLFTGMISSSYPAFFLSSFQSAKILGEGPLFSGKQKSVFKKVLVVFQFTVMIFLIIFTLVINNQLKYIRTKPLGFDRETIVYFPGYGRYWEEFESLRHELLANPNIINVTKGFPPVFMSSGIVDFSWEGKDPNQRVTLFHLGIKPDYIETFNMEIVKGRSFSYEYSTDQHNFIINETAAKVMGLSEPVGKRMSYKGNMANMYRLHNEEGIIIGVVKDFHTGPLQTAIKPVVLHYSTVGFYVLAKINPDNIPNTLTFLKEKWKEFVPGRPFKYRFLDEALASFYTDEKKLGSIIRFSTLIAIMISCLGLFGIAAIMTEQRTREIGIRKVLGATACMIAVRTSIDFLKWVVLAGIIAIPLAMYTSNQWLHNFAFRNQPGIDLYILALFAALGLALFTVIFQTIKAALANPADSLRYE